MDAFASGNPVNVVVDGNSITTSSYSTVGTFDNHLMTVEPLKSSGATHAGYGAGGHTWRHMIDGLSGNSAASQVDAAWVDGAENVLVLWEHTNSARGTASVSTIVADMEEYITGRTTLHPWHVIVINSTPQGGSSSWASTNAELAELDQWTRDNATRLGYEVVEPRTLDVFNYSGNEPEPFLAVESWAWHEKGSGWIHPLDEPKLQVAELVVKAMNGGTLPEPAQDNGPRFKRHDGSGWVGITWRVHNGTMWATP